MQDMKILTSKITMPSLGSDIVSRPGLDAKLSKLPLYPLTVIIGGAGYGKTTALVQFLANRRLPVGWYNPGPEDDHVYSFSAYLAGALDHLLPGLKEWYLRKTLSEEKFDWKTAFSVLMAGIEFFGGDTANGVLVIDDWQFVEADAEVRMFFDRFLACRPSSIHVVIISREPTSLPEVERLRAKGCVLDIAGADLTFAGSEVEELFGSIKALPLNKQQVRKILECTEGWIIAIKLLANQWQGRADHLTDSLQVETGDLEGLFEYLAQDVLGRQPQELQDFLLHTALVESFTLSYCKEVLDSDRSGSLLNTALKKGLFIYRIGQGVYRYHTLFREFLCREAELRIGSLTGLYSRIGRYFWRHENAERALHFFILGEQWETAQTILCEVGRKWVSSGRDRLLQGYLEQLPADYRQHPEICLALGDAARFACQYDQAIEWYTKSGRQFQQIQDSAGWSKSCRGIGETYLDIIQPSHAQTYLKQAYKALQAEETDEKAALLGLMAENMINQGNSRRAERYRRLMAGMRPGAADDKNNLQVRILLRTGRLREVVDVLEQKYEYEKTTYHVPRSFRETPLVLSLCYTYMGQAERALKLAQAAIDSAEKLRSPFVASVGYVRQGHALLLTYRQNREECRKSYRKALKLAEGMGVLRGLTEVYQGQSLMHALDGDWESARRIALDGIRITEKFQDRWFTAVLYHTLGMGAALCGLYDKADVYLHKALHLFERCGDLFGQSVCCWWLCYRAYKTQEQTVFIQTYAQLLDFCRKYGYEFLLESPCMLGDIAGFSSQPFREWALELSRAEASEAAAATAQYPRLVIQTLGPLKVWRDGREIAPQDWRRSGSRQLLCLLLTLRGSPVNREKLMLQLWPDADGEAAVRNFRVVFNQLCNVLEPERPPRLPCRFITRQGAAYQLAPETHCQVDVTLFENLLSKAQRLLTSEPQQARQVLQEALALYQGEYLAGETLDEISLLERERLQRLALEGAEQLAILYMNDSNYQEADRWLERILQIDGCWEKAYQLRLACYGETGNSVMLARTYQRCLSVLEQELGVKPSLQTRKIYEQYSKKAEL